MLVYILGLSAFVMLTMLLIMARLFRRSENFRQQVFEVNLENARLTSALQHEREQALTKIETLQQAHQQLTETFQNLSNQKQI